MSGWIDEELEEKDSSKHQWVNKGSSTIGYHSFYCPNRENPYGFGSVRDFSYCPHCGKELEAEN